MILEARNISFSYSGKDAELFSNISFKVENNERVWVPGPSGYGKTTLCKILAGYLKPCKGRVFWMESLCHKNGYCPVQMDHAASGKSSKSKIKNGENPVRWRKCGKAYHRGPWN